MGCSGFSCYVALRTPALSPLLPLLLLHLVLCARVVKVQTSPGGVSTTFPSAFAIICLSCFLLSDVVFSHVLTFLTITETCVTYQSGSLSHRPVDLLTCYFKFSLLAFFLSFFLFVPPVSPLQASLCCILTSVIFFSHFTSTCN